MAPDRTVLQLVSCSWSPIACCVQPRGTPGRHWRLPNHNAAGAVYISRWLGRRLGEARGERQWAPRAAGAIAWSCLGQRSLCGRCEGNLHTKWVCLTSRPGCSMCATLKHPSELMWQRWSYMRGQHTAASMEWIMGAWSSCGPLIAPTRQTYGRRAGVPLCETEIDQRV